MPPAAVAAFCCIVTVTVRDASQAPVAGAALEAAGAMARTNERGEAKLELTRPGRHWLEASAPGLQTLRKEFTIAAGEEIAVALVLPPAVRESVTVEGEIPAAGASAAMGGVAGEEVKRLPTDPPTLREALPLIPGTLRTPEGRLTISASPEHRSAMLVNGLDVTDPATGGFGATVPIDAVATFHVFKSPYLAEYGRFSQAVVTVDTRRGGDKWRAELNDPTPELRLRSGHIRGVRGFTPRFGYSGPLAPGKLYFSQSGEYRLNKTPVLTLPFPHNETWSEGWNAITQLDWIPSARRSLTASVHVAPKKVKFAGLSFYMPREVSANLRTREFHAAISARAVLGQSVLESAAAAGESRLGSAPQSEPGSGLVLKPAGSHGEWFAAQDRRARRWQWLEALSHASGAHAWKAGVSLVRSEARGWFRWSPVTAASASGEALERVEFRNRSGYSLSDFEIGAWAQDRWQLRRELALEGGLRVDWQRTTGAWRGAPRLGLAWTPRGDGATVIRAGLGWFYDRLPLSASAWSSLPVWIVGGAPLASEPDGPRGFAPGSRNWSIHAEHRFPRFVRLRAGYLDSNSRGLPVVAPGAGRVILSDAGRQRYRQVEIVSRISARQGQIFVSYVRSSAHGNLNDFLQWLGDSPSPVLRPDTYARAAADVPHRLLLWGVIPLGARTRISPVVERRSGIPFSALDERQQYAGTPNSRRFPTFFSFDFKASRDIHVRKHAVQLSFSMFNVTNHWNPDTVRWNIADAQFGEFLGQHRRRYRVDFDFLF